MTAAGPGAETHQKPGVTIPSTVVEVRNSGPDADQRDVDLAVSDAGHVAEQAPVPQRSVLLLELDG